MINLGTLPGGTASEAYGIHNNGRVVGISDNGATSHAFLYSREVMLDLNSAVTLPAGVYLTAANAINDLGQIAATGSNNQAYLLTPMVSGSTSGTISVTTNLAAATFTISGAATFGGSGLSAIFSNAPTGNYTITFGSIPGYVTPPPQTQMLGSGSTLTFAGIYRVSSRCNIDAVSIDSSNSSRVIGGSEQPIAGLPCTWTLTITDEKSNLWLDLQETTIGSAIVTTRDAVSALYAKAGVLAPSKSITYDAQFSEQGQAVNVFANMTANSAAMIVDAVQGIIDGLSVEYRIAPLELAIEDVGQVVEAFSKMPDLMAAIGDVLHMQCVGQICVWLPEIGPALQKLIAFSDNPSEVNELAGLLGQLGVDLLENSITTILKTPGAVAAVLLEVGQNVETAFFGNTAGSVLLTAN